MSFIKKLLPKKNSGFLKKAAFWFAASMLGLFTLGILGVAAAMTIFSIGLPDVTNLENLSAAQSTQIFDREENLLYTIHGEENREQIEYEDFSQDLIDATIAIEDDMFWEHSGFDVWAIGKAAMYELFGVGSKRGGSTLTQQYIKNTFLSSERSYNRKIKEIILAVRLERAFSKEEILALYLNRIPYGVNSYGAQKASEIYFGKNAKDLSLAESSVLASLTQAPSRYNPFGDNKYSHLFGEFSEEELASRSIKHETDLEVSEYARGLIGKHVDLGNGDRVYIAGRTDIVLKRMFETGDITEEERQRGLDELQRLEFRKHIEDIVHPHFVIYIKQILEERYGKDILEQGGLQVHTTIDPKIQNASEEIIAEKAASNATRYNANNAASVTINAKTGEILSMIGSADYWNEEIDGNVNVALSKNRQPGSSFKPIAYAQAFYNGYGPGSVIYDVPTRLGSKRPQNYEGGWAGQMSIRRALGQSRNIPAIKAYFLAEEQDPVIELATKMGITTLDPDHPYGWPLALGAGEVPLIEMVQAYGVFANGGKRPEITGILKVENSNGDILEEWKPQEFEEVLDPQIAFLINDILSDEANGVGPRLFIPGKINAAKTGTSTKKSKGSGAVKPSDAWTIGYTPTLVTGVWTGNSDGAGLGFNANGYDTAATIFREIMTVALADEPAEPFPRPEGIKQVTISKASGKLPGPNTPPEFITQDYFASFSVPTEQEDLFFTTKVDRISGKLPTEFTPEECVDEVTFQNFEPIADLLNWANEIKTYYAGKSVLPQEEGEEASSAPGVIGSPPTEFDDVHNAQTLANAPVLTFNFPISHSKLPYGSFDTEVDVDAKNGLEKIEYYIDERLEFITSTMPYTGFLRIAKTMKNGTRHLIVAKATDNLCYSSQTAVEIKIDEDADKEEEEPENPEVDPTEPDPDPEPEPEPDPNPEPDPGPDPDPAPDSEPFPPEEVIPPEETTSSG